MKSDTQIQKDVIDELHWNATTRTAELAVAAKDGVVTIVGHVPTYAMKIDALRAAERVTGVRAVADEVEVRFGPGVKRSDGDIAHTATEALRWHVEIPDDKIKLRVSDGYVTLEGAVEWQYQRNSAEKVVRDLQGVKGVSNFITLKPGTASPVEVGRKIRDAFHRSADLHAHQIVVEANGGIVTLKGKVRTWAERQDAERAAWSAPGTHAVKDEILVGF